MKNKIKGRTDHRGHSVLFLSGLYKQKVEKSIKDYSRNTKHKGKGIDNE